jgi:type IV pilus assembly protein PilY1
MKKHSLLTFVATAIFCCHGTLLAEDVDLFAGYNPNTGLPNVLIILDSSANWSSSIPGENCYYKDNGILTTNGPKATNPNKEQGTKMAIEKCALYNTIDALKTNPDGSALFNVGLMLFNESPAANSGGYPRQAFIPLTSANKAILKTKIAGLSIGGDKGNNAAFAKSLHEAYLYFKGGTPYKGTAGSKWDTAAVSGGKYVSPSTDSCGRNHIIFIANGGPGEVTDNDAKALLQGLGGDVNQINYPTSVVKNSDQGNWADEYARFMRGADVSNKDDAQGIITHGIAVTGASSDGLYPNYIKAMADQGYGSYYAASDVDALTLALQDAFSQIQAVNSVFASASLPISVSTQGTYLNQVFIGMFRPDRDAKPRWAGNLKQYQFVAETSLTTGGYNLFLADADKVSAISTTKTGFIKPCARSFWTPKTPDTYWSFRPQGTCDNDIVPNADQSESPDGDIVEKGAAGYMLRRGALTPSTRKVLTCNGCTLNASLPQISASNSGLLSDMVDWVRGKDVDDENKNDDKEEMRPSVHGDVVHSRPVAVDYGGNTGVVVFYGANDGTLRAINGNQGDTDGNELWSFVALEHYNKFARLRSNSPEVFYPGTPSATAARKDYFFDGPVTAYKDASKTWIYATMRRGGNTVYAFDVSDPTDPELKWKHDGVQEVDGTKTVHIGQTWSAPKVLKAPGFRSGGVGTEKPLLIMGGGYDSCEDGTVSSDRNTCGSNPTGSQVYVLDADTGKVLNTLNTDRSVAGDVTVVTDGQGLATFAYAADTGGNVYRINIGTDAPGNWTIHKIASLGCPTSNCPGGVANRKFLFGPEVVVSGPYNSVLLGSGDREHPLATDAVTASVSNAFFMIKDDVSVTSPSVISLDQGVLVQVDPDSQGLTSEQQAKLDEATNKGWYLQFGSDTHDNEQVVTSAVVVFGVVTFSTHTPTIPNSNSCSTNLGTARVYNIQYANANPIGSVRYQPIEGGGLPPSPVAGMVTVAKPGTDGSGTTMTVPFLIGGDPRSPIEVKLPTSPAGVATHKSRVYWYIQQ